MIKMNLNRIPLDNVYNIRNFGGYEVHGVKKDGKKYSGVSKHYVLFRSGEVTNPTDRDVDIIVNDLKIKTIFDLRGEEEIEKSPNYFSNHDKIELIPVDLFLELDDEVIDEIHKKNGSKGRMAAIYVLMIEEAKEKIKYIIETVAKKLEKGPILYHCKAGKDRAGVMSMFLQAIAGFDKRDMIADYQISTELLGEHGADFINTTYPQYIEFLFDHLDKNYGGPLEYLKSLGIKDETFSKIKSYSVLEKETFKSQSEMDLMLRRLPLKTIDNFRSLGGNPTIDGGITRHGIFYRSGLPHEIIKEDMDRVKGLNVKTVIDLRGVEERSKEPNGFEKDEFFNVVHIDVLKDLDPTALMETENITDMAGFDRENMSKEAIARFFEENENIMGKMYVHILKDKKDVVLEIMNTIADNMDKGAVLFHCTAGKDRTGVTGLLLNTIANMDKRDIIADYQVSETYINLGDGDFTKSSPEFIKLAIDYIENGYGNGIEYLKSIGFLEEKIAKIKNAFVEK